VERHLVQILVVVANSQLETLAAEVEKGSLRTVIGQRLRGPKFLVKSISGALQRGTKGNQVEIPDAKLDSWQHKLSQRRQRVLLEGFSFLLNKQAALKLDYPERRL
jgi:ABC-type hemin transport system ATPase subunit